ncbi:hypothetical protein B0H19DRAFT_1303640 [Mycena capillaripes]|nr:hypothetical protein B0H19DRAFT_1303640 [Mycena capillaripes]
MSHLKLRLALTLAQEGGFWRRRIRFNTLLQAREAMLLQQVVALGCNHHGPLGFLQTAHLWGYIQPGSRESQQVQRGWEFHTISGRKWIQIAATKHFRRCTTKFGARFSVSTMPSEHPNCGSGDTIQAWAADNEAPSVMWLYGPASAENLAIAQSMAQNWAALSLHIPGLWQLIGLAVEADPAIYDKTMEKQAYALIVNPNIDVDAELSGRHLIIIDEIDE